MCRVLEIIRRTARALGRGDAAAGQVLSSGHHSRKAAGGRAESGKKEYARGRMGLAVAAYAAALCAALLLPGTGSRAAEGYGYTVTFYPGNHGTFGDAGQVSVDNHASGSEYRVDYGGSAVTVSGLAAGDVVSFDAAMEGAVNLGEGNKYYVKGIRQGGRDNSTVDTPAFRVEGDRDYVVAYGIRGNMTSYVVNYQDENGNTLAPSRTYYGNVGDKPVIAFLYIEGYQPQAYNLTKTLSANSAENVFTFIYTRIPEQAADPGNTGQEPGTGTPGGNQGGTGQTGGNQGGTGQTGGTQDGTGQNPGGQEENQAGGQEPGTQGQGDQTGTPGGQEQGNQTQDGTQGTDGGENTPQTPGEPQDVQDLDEQPVPLAGGNPGDGKSLPGLPLTAGILAALAVVITAGVWYGLRLRKKAGESKRKNRE